MKKIKKKKGKPQAGNKKNSEVHKKQNKIKI